MTKGENRYLRVGMNESINLILVKVIKATTQNCTKLQLQRFNSTIFSTADFQHF